MRFFSINKYDLLSLSNKLFSNHHQMRTDQKIEISYQEAREKYLQYGIATDKVLSELK